VRFQDLDSWLRWQESLHPREIELGLERLRPVHARLRGMPPDCRVITVAGTNGKGSCVAVAEAVAIASGLRVGAYTSPHLFRYNERVRLDGQPVDDLRLMQAFESVDQARRGVPLTYFEFGTLAALQIFFEDRLDLVILEVGLGGRLDAVNIVDADVAVITSVGLDHQAWLGMDRESIGAEKAGIVRSGRPLVLGDPDPPGSVLRIAEERGASLDALGQSWFPDLEDEGWWLRAGESRFGPLPYGPLRGALVRNAGCALRALDWLDRCPEVDTVGRAIGNLQLPGRLQRFPGSVEWIVDLAHNTQGAELLAEMLESDECPGKTRAVFGMLADKDIGGVAAVMAPVVDEWLITGVGGSRGASADEVAAQVAGAGAASIEICRDVQDACARAGQRSSKGDRVVVFGSFFVVGPALEAFELYSPPFSAQENRVPSR
jgi:dihydrofolate synthase/folylpolyglutamate synthase